MCSMWPTSSHTMEDISIVTHEFLLETIVLCTYLYQTHESSDTDNSCVAFDMEEIYKTQTFARYLGPVVDRWRPGKRLMP